MKSNFLNSKTSKVFALVLFLVFTSSSGVYAQGLEEATTQLSSLLNTAYKLLSVIIGIVALVFLGTAIAKIKQGKNEGWTSLMTIVLVVAIWLFAVPPFINKVVEIGTGRSGNIENNSGQTL